MAEKIPMTAEEVWGLQLNNLQKHGYAMPDYSDIEHEIPLPDKEKLQLGLALLVDYQTPIPEQCQKLGIMNYLVDLNYHKNLHPKPQGRWGWIYGVEDGKQMLGKSPNQAVSEFSRNARRGLMTVEGLALYRENHDLLKDHYVDLPGSRYGGLLGGAPSLFLYVGQAALFDGWVEDGEGGYWGSASTGSV